MSSEAGEPGRRERERAEREAQDRRDREKMIGPRIQDGPQGDGAPPPSKPVRIA